MGATYYLGRFIITPLARLVYRPHIEGRGERPEDRAGHLREQPPVVPRLDRDPGRGAAARPLPREGELLRGHRLLGLGVARVLHRDRRGAGAARRRSGGARRARPAAHAARAGQRRRALPRGHALARRTPLQGPHRRRLPRAADRRAGRAGRAHRHRRGDAGRREDALAQAPRHRAVRRAARPLAPRSGRRPGAPAASRPTTSWPRSTPSRARSSRTPTTRSPRTPRSSASSRSCRTSGADAAQAPRDLDRRARAAPGSSPSWR